MASSVDRSSWPSLPDKHQAFLDRALEVLTSEPGIVGVAIGGSFVTDQIDDLSDLDFVIAVDPAHWPDMLDRRVDVAGRMGALLEAFTGEHVGEPRLLICLYGPPLLHIDLKFVSLDDAHERVEDPAIVWEKDGLLTAAFERSDARYPQPDHEWIEERMWIWIHFYADKIERGELLQAVDFLNFIRTRVLAPMAHVRAGTRPDGVRRIELAAPELSDRFARTIGAPDREALCDALDETLALYTELRGDPGPVSAVEREVREYVSGLRARLALN